MKNRLSSASVCIALIFILSACVIKETLVQRASAPLPAAVLPPVASVSVPAESPTPSGPAIETGIIPGSLRDFEVNVGDRVLFAFDKSNLEDSTRSILMKQASWLRRYPAVIVTIEGHCDERGTREYNIALGARRAASVKDYLISLGVASGRLKIISFGKERPVCAESNENCWFKNRRAVSSLTNAAGSTAVATK